MLSWDVLYIYKTEMRESREKFKRSIAVWSQQMWKSLLAFVNMNCNIYFN